MKKLALLILVMGCAAGAFAQNATNEKTLFERVTQIEKKMDWFNFYLNMQGSFDASFNYDQSGLSEAAFKMRQFRIEAKGNITPWLSYRWRQRLNRGNNGGNNIDNMPTSIDIAGIGVNHQLQFQILDSRNGSQDETYGPGFEKSRAPLLYTLNWNGNLFDGIYKTRWSASVMSETKDKQMYYYALGNDFTFSKKVNMFVDFMYSDEQIDRKGIITGIVGNEDGHNALDAEYLSVVTKVNYRFQPKWNAFVKGMYETASVSKTRGDIEKGNYRTSYGYLAGIEYYPLEDSNLHFFCTFVGRSYKFTDRAAQKGYNTQRLEVGFIYQLPMF